MTVRIPCMVKCRACSGGHRIAGGHARKREDIGRIVALFKERRMTGGLREATIKSGRPARPRYLHIGAVKREAAGLVDVESIVQHATNDAPRLANSKDQDFARCRRAFK